MITAIPTIEITNHTHPPRIWRPDREGRAARTVNNAQLSAELLVNAPLIPLSEQIQIGLTQRRQKRIRITGATRPAVVSGNQQVVRIDTIRIERDPFKI